MEFVKTIRRMARNKLTLVGAVVIGSMVLIAILAPVIAPYDPIKQNIRGRLQTPSTTHLFGTDILGRDVFSRIKSREPSTSSPSSGSSMALASPF